MEAVAFIGRKKMNLERKKQLLLAKQMIHNHDEYLKSIFHHIRMCNPDLTVEKQLKLLQMHLEQLRNEKKEYIEENRNVR